MESSETSTVVQAPAGSWRDRFLRPRAWRSGEYVSFTAVLVMFISTVGLNWVTVSIEFKDPFLGISWVDQNLDFKVLENGTFSAAIIVLLALCLLSIPWKKPVAWTGPVFCLALLGCFAYYLYGLVEQAYDILGLLKSIPLVGGMLESLARDSIKSVRPQAGFYFFAAGNLALVAGTVLRLRRKGRPA